MMVFTEADYLTRLSESEDSTRRRGEAEKIVGDAARFLAGARHKSVPTAGALDGPLLSRTPGSAGGLCRRLEHYDRWTHRKASRPGEAEVKAHKDTGGETAGAASW